MKRAPVNKSLSILLIMLASLAFSCSSEKVMFDVSVNSLVNPTYQSTVRSQTGNRPLTFRILPADTSVRKDDLLFLEFARFTSNALVLRGFRSANDALNPDLWIFLDYGISDAQTETYTYRKPKVVVSGYSSSTTTGTLRTRGSNTEIQAKTTYKPIYDVEYETWEEDHTYFTRLIRIDAYDNASYQATGKATLMWSVTSHSSGSSSDLRLVVPYMLAACSYYFGVSSDNVRFFSVPYDDERTSSIRGQGMQQTSD